MAAKRTISKRSDYALYHLRIMTPAHDERSSIAAKGLTGEGYKGHVFWDPGSIFVTVSSV
ncbi:hypothetical protein ACLBR5_19115 [Escherichia coli]